MDSRESLIEHLLQETEKAVAAELPLLKKRIAAAMEYMAAVTKPNQHTLQHIKWYLTGAYDNTLDLGEKNT